jgi:hypothetical protein
VEPWGTELQLVKDDLLRFQWDDQGKDDELELSYFEGGVSVWFRQEPEITNKAGDPVHL